MQRSVYGTVDEVKKKTGRKDLFMGQDEVTYWNGDYVPNISC